MREAGLDEKKTLKQAQAVVDGFAACLDELEFDPKDVQHYALVAIYCSFLDFCAGIVALYRSRSWWVAPIVLRAYAEAMADFVNLSRDRGYLAYIERSFYSQALTFCTGVESVPRLASFAASEDFAAYRDELRAKLKDITAQGAGHIRVKDRFRMAGMEEFYASVYAKLCSHAHNNLDALEARHLAPLGEGRFRLAVRNDMPAQEKATWLYTALSMLHDATLTMREVLGLRDEARLAPALERWRALHRLLKPVLLA
ncbi:MAG: DUF5677 domain-containing protein [Thermodesulfobacteriota bacterium]